MKSILVVLFILLADSVLAQRYEAVVDGAMSVAFCCGTTQLLKHTIDKQRPDGSDNRSFPSGHAAIAFCGAHVLHKELGEVSPWISVGGYAVATAIASKRVIDNHHDWLDATAGAAIGIATTELGYWLGNKITGRQKRMKVAVAPNSVAMLIQL